MLRFSITDNIILATGITCFILMYMPYAVFAQEASELISRDISIKLKGAEGMTELTASELPKGMTLELDIVTVKYGDTISDLLMSRRVFPNSDAYSIIFDQNPDLRNIDHILPATELLILKLKIEEKTENQPIAVLGVNETLEDDLREDIGALGGNLEKLWSFELHRFENPESRDLIIQSTEDIKDYLDVLGSDHFPVSKELLTQIKNESEYLNSLLDQRISFGGQLK